MEIIKSNSKVHILQSSPPSDKQNGMELHTMEPGAHVNPSFDADVDPIPEKRDTNGVDAEKGPLPSKNVDADGFPVDDDESYSQFWMVS